MIAGLFVCDHIQAKYKDEYGDYPDMFAQLFPDFEWILYDVCNGHFPENFEDCDVYMATGSKYSVYENLDWIVQLKKTIVQLYEQKKHFVGFCFGHQLIGEALGGKVHKSTNGWCVGVHEYQVIEPQEWMVPISEKVNILMMCQDQILELPKEAVVIAKSENCPNAMIQIGDHFLGIQGHPEFTKNYNKVLMQNRVDRMGEAVVKNGIDSLANSVHTAVIRDWVIAFLSRKKPQRISPSLG